MTGYAQLSAKAQKEIDEWAITAEAEKQRVGRGDKNLDLSEVVRTFDNYIR